MSSSCFAGLRPAHRPPGRRPSWPAALSLTVLAAAAQAQTAPTPPPAPNRVVITGNPLGNERLAQPSAVLTGEALALRRAGTLGDTLSGLAGVSASGFGPQSSRPVIRGLDGDRIRLLDNRGASADASNLSFDHAVAVDPLVIDRIEVLRGPAALLYGGNATGGVVNTLDNRIPREALDRLGGRAELRSGGAAAESAASALLEGGAGGLNWHVDAAQRRSGDLRTPRFTPERDGVAQAPTRRVANSAGVSQAGAVGASWADAQGHLGAALDDYHNDYGVTVAPDVRIRMQRQRLQLAGERRGLAGPFSSVSLQASRTLYQHQELEGSGTVGTTFHSRGSDARVQLQQAPLAALGGRLTGVVGLQAETLDFAALGEEAFVPSNHSRSTGLFTLQTLSLTGLELSAGARLERSQVRSDGDAAQSAGPSVGTPFSPHFGPALTRDFSPRSVSLGAVLPLAAWGAPGWRASATLGSTQRAPAYYELLADGVHVATGAYERGSTVQQLERSRHLELGLHWQQAGSSLQASLFQTRFANYIALTASGALIPQPDGSRLPEYRYTGLPARLSGLELEARHRWPAGTWRLEATGTLDWLRGQQADNGEPLPRLPPLRLQVGLDAVQGAWRGGVQARAQARQDRVPLGDTATPGALLLGVWAGWQQRWPGADALWTLKLDNLGDTLASNASALRSARLLAPAGGRALTAGLRLSF